jgi:hypothetical protein
MIKIGDLVKIPPFFLRGFKHGGARHPYESFLKLRHLIFVHSLNTKYDKKLKILNFKILSESDPDYFYYVSIGSNEEKLNTESNVKVFCSCPDFRYTFAYALHKLGALLFPEIFPKPFTTIPPKHRNPYMIPWACKHIYTIANIIRFKPNKISLTEEFVLKFNKRNKNDFIPKLIVTDYELTRWINEGLITDEFIKNHIGGVIWRAEERKNR